MGVIIWVTVGGLAGWLASFTMRDDARNGIFLNMLVGIAGAFMGAWLLGPSVGVAGMDDGLSMASVVVALAGAIVLLLLLRMLSMMRAR